MTKIMIIFTVALLLSVLYTVEGQGGGGAASTAAGASGAGAGGAAAAAAAGAAGGGYGGGYGGGFSGYRPRYGYATYLPNPAVTSSNVFTPFNSHKASGVGILSDILNHAIQANLLNNGPVPPAYG